MSAETIIIRTSSLRRGRILAVATALAGLLAVPSAGQAATSAPAAPVGSPRPVGPPTPVGSPTPAGPATAAATSAATPTVRIRPVTFPVVSGQPAQLALDSGGTTMTGAKWAFGDGRTSSGLNPTHTWAAPGSYTVTADVTLTGGTTTTATTAVAVLPPAPTTPTAAFAFDLGGPSVSVTSRAGARGGPVTSWDLRVSGPKGSNARPHGIGGWYVEHHDCGLYTYTLTAYGPGGSAAWTSAPLGRCAAPSNPAPVQATISGPRGRRALAVSWLPADYADRLVVAGYHVTVSPGGGDVSLQNLDTSVTVPLPFSVACGTAVTVSVTAFNVTGSGPAATVTVPNSC